MYADDLKGPSATFPIQLKTTSKDTTIAQLKREIEIQVNPKIQVKH
jgi:hypothetical protein